MSAPQSPIPLSRSIAAYAGYAAVRTAMAAALLAPPRSLIRRAGVLGSWYAGLGMNSKRLARATSNIEIAFPHFTPEEVHACAVLSYAHLFQVGAEIAFGQRLFTEEGWANHVAIGDVAGKVVKGEERTPGGLEALLSGRPCVLITGHCGNWEVLGYSVALLGFPVHALYRPLDAKPLDRWLRATRERRGLTLIDKFGAVNRLPTLIAGGAPVAFVADQNGGDRGVFVPFFGRLTSTYKSLALLAMQFDAVIVTGGARRVTSREEAQLRFGSALRLEKPPLYVFESSDCFSSEQWRAHSDPLFYLCARVRRGIEAQVLRAPEQYLWMHRIWRSRPRHERDNRPLPDSIRGKLLELPWMTADAVDAIAERSRHDGELLRASGKQRFD